MQGGGGGAEGSTAATAPLVDQLDVESRHDDDEQQQQRAPLLARNRSVDDDGMSISPVQRAISQTYQSTAHLAKLLPTGTVLAFQLLSPVVTAQGHCAAAGGGRANRAMTGALLALCALSCFALSFTDSFREEEDGNDGGEKKTVRYGVATLRGLWVIDGGAPLDPRAAAAYRLRFLDLVHAAVSVMVFAAVALFDRNVVSCFYPVPSEDAARVLAVMPVAIGVVGSMLFVTFPTTRHGIGFPLSSR